MTSTKLVQIMRIMPMGHKWACPWGYMWYIGLYRENIKKSSCLKPQGIELWYLVCSITKTSGPLPSLFKLWSRSTKFVQIMTLGPKMVLSQGATCFTQAYGKHEKIFLYETTNHRALIFDMKYNLVDLYQLCSSYTPGAKNVPASVVTWFTILHRL